ncbi:hypothetical protein [Plantactinospora sp. WMMB782]|uniref:phage tail protein n=1 Tax=Plantactinospora sp. WMMB782 TaxID=3404121 RepID=UPI003B9355B5
MADQVIGRVFVKVTPDTSKFREEARAALEREEKRLPELEVELEVDLAEGTTQKVAAQAKAVQKAAEAALEDLTLKVNLDDAGSVQSALARINRELVNVGAVEIPVALNEDDLKATQKLLEDRLAEVATVKIRVDTDDESDIKRAIDKIDAQLADLKRVELDIHLDEASLLGAKAKLEADLKRVEVPVVAEVSKPSLGIVEAVLAGLTRTRDTVIRPVLDRGALAALSAASILSGWRALTQSVDQARSAFTRLFAEMPKVILMTTQVLGLSGAFAAAGANTIGLLGSVAQLVPLLLAIPGVAIGIGVMIAALQDFGAQLPGIAAGFTALQDTISEAFWSVARGPINDLLTAALPMLSAGLEATATQIGGFFASLAAEFGRAGGFISQIPAMFDALNESIAIFTRHTPALNTIATIFGQIGSGLLPPLAALMGQVADEFARWLSDATAGDGLQDIVDGAIESLEGLFEVVKGAAGIFGGFWQAARDAGASTLTTLGKSLQDFADRLADPQIQQSLSKLFGAAFEGMDRFLTKAGPAFEQVFLSMADVLATVLPAVGQVLGGVAEALGEVFANPALTDGFTAFIGGVLKAIASLTPLLTPIGDLIGALGPTLGLLASSIGQVIGSLAPTFGALLSSLQPLILLLTGTLSEALTAISPLIQTMGETLAVVFGQLAVELQPVMDALIDLIVGLMPQLIPLIIQLAPLILQIAQIALPVMASLLQALLPTLSAIISAITPIVSGLTELLAILAPVLIPTLTWLAEVLANVARAVVEGLITAIEGLIQILTGVINFVTGVFTGDWSKAWDAVWQIIDGIWKLILGVIESTVFAIVSLVGVKVSEIRALWENAWTIVLTFFRTKWEQIFAFLTTTFINIVSLFAGLWGRISGFVSGLFSSLVSLYQSGMSKAAKAVDDGVDTVIRFFRNLPGDVVRALGNLGSILVGAGRDLIGGLLSGIRSMAGEIVATIKNYVTDKIPDYVKDFFGINSPSRMFAEFGANLMQGLAIGIEDESTRVIKALDAVMSDVEDYEFRPPQTPDLGVNASLYGGADAAPTGNTIIYNAAPGSSLGSEEDLFSALGRARAGW